MKNKIIAGLLIWALIASGISVYLYGTDSIPEGYEAALQRESELLLANQIQKTNSYWNNILEEQGKEYALELATATQDTEKVTKRTKARKKAVKADTGDVLKMRDHIAESYGIAKKDLLIKNGQIVISNMVALAIVNKVIELQAEIEFREIEVRRNWLEKTNELIVSNANQLREKDIEIDTIRASLDLSLKKIGILEVKLKDSKSEMVKNIAITAVTCVVGGFAIGVATGVYVIK